MKRKIVNLFKRNNTALETTSGLLPGVPAPEFSLETLNGEPVTLGQFQGRPVILAFYPADGTPVCSSQLALYNECLHLFDEHNAQLLAISVDDIASHKKFASALQLRFPLLADDDPAGELAERYGVLNPGDGKSERALFVIDKQGAIHWSEISPRGVNPGAHGILTALESLR